MLRQTNGRKFFFIIHYLLFKLLSVSASIVTMSACWGGFALILFTVDWLPWLGQANVVDSIAILALETLLSRNKSRIQYDLKGYITALVFHF